MSPDIPSSIQIVEKAKSFGASLAGIARVSDLKNSPSHNSPYYEGYGKAEWPAEAKSVLVLELHHTPSEVELDYWDRKPYGTPGNRELVQIGKNLKQWLADECNINGNPLPYQVEEGGVFLKDAAALAGLGVIGKNNLLIAPEYGPCLRLRAMFLDVELAPITLSDFDPCESCAMPCRQACPQDAFKSGSFQRDLCNLQMAKDEMNEVIVAGDPKSNQIIYCRACELACIVAPQTHFD
jgi:epoxyqueuosine reductase